MRTHSFVSAAAFALGLALTASPTLLAQEPSDGTLIKRSPSASDRIAVDQGQLEQRRSPGGGGGGGVRGGGGGRGGDGGGRVAVPRGPGPGGGRIVGGGGRPGGRAVIVQPRGFYSPRCYYPYSSFYYGGGYFDTFGYWGNGWGPGFGPGFGYAGAYNGWGGGYPYGYGGGYGNGGGYDVGRLRLQVQPRDAEVFIDGYYSGQVDDFDGRLQGLTLETGGYSVEIRKPGWETLTFDVRVTPGRTTNYKGELIPQRP